MKRVFLMLITLVSVLSTYAQKDSYQKGIIVKQTEENKDSVINVQIIPSANPKYDFQYGVQVVMNGEMTTIEPKSILLFKADKNTYVSRQIVDESGNTKDIFAKRVHYSNDTEPSIYEIYEKDGSSNYYMEQGDAPLTRIVKNSNGTNQLQDYLVAENNKNGGNAEIEEYIMSMKDTPQSFKRHLKVVRSGNPNTVPHFRWGVGAGAFYNHIHLYIPSNLDTFNPLKENLNRDMLRANAFAFVDIPTVRYLSIHSELSFNNVSYVYKYNYSEGTNNLKRRDGELEFNRTSIDVPILLRFYLANMKGKFIPFVDAGFDVNFNIMGKKQERIYHTDKNGNLSNVVETELSDAMHFDVLIGGGVEYRMNPKHSFFLNARYYKSLKRLERDIFIFKQRGAYISLSYNL